jgi:hypothetical protein
MYLQMKHFLPIIVLLIFFLLLTNLTIATAKTDNPEIIFNISLSEKKCQIAIWLTDENGNFVDTIYVTRKTAIKGLGNKKGKLDGVIRGTRLSLLPVWAYQRGVDYGEGNFYPPKNKPLVDAVTSATPKTELFIWKWIPATQLKPGNYYYYVEVNKSGDQNKHHDYSWYRGQPSVVWKGNITVGDQNSETEAEIIGHGHVAGADGSINTDLSTLTTAIKLIKNIRVIYKTNNKK